MMQRPFSINIVLGPFLQAPPGPTGAVEKCWHGVAQCFAHEGHQVTIIEKSGLQRTDSDSLRWRQVAGYERPARLAQALAYDFIYSHRTLSALPPADVTVTNTFFLPTLATVLQRKLLARQAGVFIPNVARMPKGQCRFFSDVPLIITPSAAAADLIRAELKGRPLGQRVEVMPNPVDTDLFRPGPPHDPTAPLKILYAGRIGPEKGITELIEAFAKARENGLPQNIELVIVGPQTIAEGGGGEAYMTLCRQLAEGHPVTFKPVIRDPSQLAAEMQAATLFAYPSLADAGETFGVSVLEAMATGSVPIVSDLACFRDFLADGSNAIVFNHRSDPVGALTAALLKAVADRNALSRLAAEGVRRAQDFSYEAVSTQYLDLFGRLLHSASSCNPAA